MPKQNRQWACFVQIQLSGNEASRTYSSRDVQTNSSHLQAKIKEKQITGPWWSSGLTRQSFDLKVEGSNPGGGIFFCDLIKINSQKNMTVRAQELRLDFQDDVMRILCRPMTS